MVCLPMQHVVESSWSLTHQCLRLKGCIFRDGMDVHVSKGPAASSLPIDLPVPDTQQG